MFRVFVPWGRVSGPLTIQFFGTETIELGGQEILLGRYKIQTESLALGVWADKKRKLRRLSCGRY